MSAEVISLSERRSGRSDEPSSEIRRLIGAGFRMDEGIDLRDAEELREIVRILDGSAG